MILRILGWLAGLLVALMLLALIAWWKPVETSAIVWPSLETLLIETNDFVGVTTDGLPIPGLFVLQTTGFDGSDVVNATNTRFASLREEQRKRATFPVTSDEWRRWANIHISTWQGVGFLEMTPQQAINDFALLRASLSAKGYETSRYITCLEGHLADLLGNPPG